jgi:autotransporter-associated beta strand protein
MILTGINGDANIDTGGARIALSSSLSGLGGLRKLGKSMLSLSGESTYAGNTTILAGTLVVNNTTGSGTGVGQVLVNTGGTLSGSGFIAGPLLVNSGGTLAPGNSPGILTINNQVVFQPASTFSIDVNGLTAGTGYDQLQTTGPVSLAGSLVLFFGTFTPTANDILFLINNTGSGATTGSFQFADNSKIGTFNGRDWYITYDANNSVTPSLNGGNDVAIYTVPEPGMFVLLASSIFASLFLARAGKLRSR